MALLRKERHCFICPYNRAWTVLPHLLSGIALCEGEGYEELSDEFGLQRLPPQIARTAQTLRQATPDEEDDG